MLGQNKSVRQRISDTRHTKVTGSSPDKVFFNSAMAKPGGAGAAWRSLPATAAAQRQLLWRAVTLQATRSANQTVLLNC